MFNVIRSISPGWDSPVTYPPLAEHQKDALQALLAATTTDKSDEDIDSIFDEACFTIFAHHRWQYPETKGSGKIFSVVCAFSIFSSVRGAGFYARSTTITQTLAKLIYANRSVIIKRTKEISDRESCSMFAYVHPPVHVSPFSIDLQGF